MVLEVLFEKGESALGTSSLIYELEVIELKLTQRRSLHDSQNVR